MTKKGSFIVGDAAHPHKKRAKVIIADHPEIKQLLGRNPYTFLVITLCVSVQIVLAFYLQHASWVIIFLASYLVGAFACHALFVTIHECTHNLLFKNRTLNILAGIIANLPLVFPSSVSFQKYHMKHHSHLGISDFDADVPFEWEADLINNSWYGKALWLLFFPLFQFFRPFRLKEIEMFDTWTVINWIIQLSFMAAVVYFLGMHSTMFMVLSFFFSIGLHPLGARWIQEHYLTHGDEQETKSYYGMLNVVNLNIGYHNEHHDFPSVPWNKLPQIRKMANQHYDNLGHHTSYTGLLFRFLFDKDLSLYSRILRPNKVKDQGNQPNKVYFNKKTMQQEQI